MMQQPPLAFLPAGDPAQLSLTERDRVLWIAAERYMRGLLTSEQYGYVKQQYGGAGLTTMPTRSTKKCWP